MVPNATWVPTLLCTPLWLISRLQSSEPHSGLPALPGPLPSSPCRCEQLPLLQEDSLQPVWLFPSSRSCALFPTAINVRAALLFAFSALHSPQPTPCLAPSLSEASSTLSLPDLSPCYSSLGGPLQTMSGKVRIFLP